MGLSHISSSHILSMASLTVLALCMVGLGLGQGGPLTPDGLVKAFQEAISICSDGGSAVTWDQYTDCYQSETKMKQIKEIFQSIPVTLKPTTDGPNKMKFDKVDKNKDGKMSFEEIKTFIM